ncbi:Aste57867_13190 [Aphanomyces stellatus]|uniref:non-specific serine/threonine protein kinase n=1 Tax=Aphanomyces stellatus TaxID=120398 RepID=A0A485KXS4_9STRA|nr:hypothetical protein As57867_013141 [Aphanomyces stellatus]VFT90031.1 Aste57867_13190 [Aphanomyces stellatus]
MGSIIMDDDAIAFRAEAQKGSKNYNQYQPLGHSGPQHARPTVLHVPKNYLIWDWRSGLMGLRDLNDPLGRIDRCRCGYVFRCVYFRQGGVASDQHTVAVKLMDKRLIQLENDDLESEVRAMRFLQHIGMETTLRNKHVIRWETAECSYNHYIATEYIANGSLISYMKKKFTECRSELHQCFGGSMDPAVVGKEVGRYFLLHVTLPLFHQILCALAYIHGQNLCHLDFDPYNIAVDVEGTIRILDFGSSHLVDGRGCVGGGRDFPQIKTKAIYRSPELKKNNRDRAKYMHYLRHRPADHTFRDEQRMIPQGFAGAKSDIFSAGVVCLEMMLYGFHYGDCKGHEFVSAHNPQYREQFYAHFNSNCSRPTCFLCQHNLPIPSFMMDAVSVMMAHNPVDRHFDAVQLANKWKKEWDTYAAEANRVGITAAAPRPSNHHHCMPPPFTTAC